MFENFVGSFIKDGSLLVRLPNGKTLSLGGATEADAPVIARIHDIGAMAGIMRSPALGLGEAYMDGRLTFERGDIFDLLTIGIRNLRYQKNPRGPLVALRRFLETANARVAAKRNVAHHYDLSGELYRLFLDGDQQYSCAYFADPSMSLEEAQRAKKRHIAAKLLLERGQRVLDIGCGWGGLALTLAGEHGVDVHGITLSEEQHKVAQERAAASGLDRHAAFEIRDYRDVVGPFDRIVSVGMFEHVGPSNYGVFFETLARLLDDNGVALLHTIGRSDGPTPPSPFFQKYIFPGGYIPSLSEVMPSIEQAGLIVTDIEVLRLHYAETLRIWRDRFAAHRAEVEQLYDARFYRMWEFYLAGSEASFRTGGNVVFQFQLAKRNNVVPITRDYITDFDRAAAPADARVAAE